MTRFTFQGHGLCAARRSARLRDRGARFFGELLGLPEVPKPPALAVRGGAWFQCGAQQIHVGVEKDFRAAKKAHPALRLLDETSFHALWQRLKQAGVPLREDDGSETRCGSSPMIRGATDWNSSQRKPLGKWSGQRAKASSVNH